MKIFFSNLDHLEDALARECCRTPVTFAQIEKQLILDLLCFLGLEALLLLQH